MGDLSPHFSRAEFKCNCGACDCDTVDAGLLTLLEKIRDHFGRPVTITSGHRCREYNRRVGGAPDSQHMRGRAADIKVAGRTPAEVHTWLAEFHDGGLGRYHTFTHVDTRRGAVRWSGR